MGLKCPKKFKGGTVVDAKSISVTAATTGLIVPNKGKKSKKMEAIASALRLDLQERPLKLQLMLLRILLLRIIKRARRRVMLW